MVQSWCTVDEVNARVKGSPDAALLQEYADYATSTLYVMTGRRYNGEATVMAQFQIDRRGYVNLVPWLPVRGIVSAEIAGQPVACLMSAAGSYAVLSRLNAGLFVDLILQVGQNPPEMGRRAAAALAADMLRGDSRYAESGATDTRPDARLTSITRQGVTYTYASPSELAEGGLTGIPEVDRFVKSVNPTGAQFQSKVVTVR
jgi:hypothetical protein